LGLKGIDLGMSAWLGSVGKVVVGGIPWGLPPGFLIVSSSSHSSFIQALDFWASNISFPPLEGTSALCSPSALVFKWI